jgi:hypothetical protein
MYSKTAIVYKYPFEPLQNKKTKDDYYYRLRSCDTNLTSDTPANQYQRLKIIQNTVRVASSLYTMNLGALNAYTKPSSATYNVCWNQMSDRPIPSVQKTYVPTKGSIIGSSSTRHTVTGPRPGAQSPGGVGCDIKHNSYDRYLNRLKGRGPVRRGVIPPTFGVPVIPFNQAAPVYGGKTVKTSIVSGCNCPDGSNNDNVIYTDPYTEPQPYNLGFSVGQIVYAKEGSNDYYSKATIITVINSNDYIVRFEDNVEEEKTMSELRIYFPCNCSNSPTVIIEPAPSGSSIYGVECVLLASALLGEFGSEF